MYKEDKYEILENLRASFIFGNPRIWFFLFRVLNYIELTNDCTITLTKENYEAYTGYKAGTGTKNLIGEESA